MKKSVFAAFTAIVAASSTDPKAALKFSLK